MTKPRFETPDLTSANIDNLATLFPSVITEARGANGQLRRAVNFDKLRQLLGDTVVEGDEAYEFTWVGKRAAIAEAGRPIRRTLRPCPEESKNWDTTENLYIEGDNLEVLKLLQESYLGKVKMIYIDPPYNTGNDFVYRDNFTQSKDEYEEEAGVYNEEGERLFRNTESNGRFHSDWCSMIYPRLVLARNLLAEDGVVIINMDENEITNVQKLCNEVIGEANDLGTIVWDKRNPKGDARGVSYQHEYFLVYSRNKEVFLNKCKMQRPKKNAETILVKASQYYKKLNESYTLVDVNREFATWISAQTEFSGGEKAYNRIDENGDVYRPVSMAWPNKKKAPDDYFIPLFHPVTKKACPLPERGWRNPSSTMKELLDAGLILFGKDETTQPNRKYLLKENMYENIPSLLYYGGSDTDLLVDLDIPFDTPKVVNIVKDHIQSFANNNDIVLDFFSGSATTAHAVMQLNADDSGKRKYIMVQLPEVCTPDSEAGKAGYKNICEIGKERIRRAGDKIKVDNKDKEGIDNLDIGFRVLKLDSTNMKDVYYSTDEYDQTMLGDLESNIKDDRSDIDLLYGCLIDWALPLSMPHTQEQIEGVTVHTYNSGDLIACFAEHISEKVVREIANRCGSPERQGLATRVVFRDNSFASSPEKINVEEIFKLLAPNTSVRVI